jgi:hypothetical protein
MSRQAKTFEIVEGRLPSHHDRLQDTVVSNKTPARDLKIVNEDCYFGKQGVPTAR